MDYHGEKLIHRLICMDRGVTAWYENLKRAEEDYMYLLSGADAYTWSPQQARGILPLDLKSELVMTGFVSDWIHFFRLRSCIAETGKPHPDIQILADNLMQEFIDRGYCTYEQIKRNN